MWDQVDVVLKDAKGILDELQAYKGAGAEIREVPLTLPHLHLSGTCRCSRVCMDLQRELHELMQQSGLHLDVLLVSCCSPR